MYLILTKSKNDGGAGLTPGEGSWRFVESIFPLHNHAFNKAWIQKWSRKYLLDQHDLDEIRNKFGEDVAFYFAFVQSYFRFQLFPAAAGFAAWMLLGQFSVFYALVSCLWSVVFFEYWKKKEVDLAVNWGVRGVSNIHQQRPQFQWDYEAVDPVTGEPVKVYDPIKRIKTQLLQIPFALTCIIALGSLVVACNSLEVFINEVYTGGGKQYLVRNALKYTSSVMGTNILTLAGFHTNHHPLQLHTHILDHFDACCRDLDTMGKLRKYGR